MRKKMTPTLLIFVWLFSGEKVTCKDSPLLDGQMEDILRWADAVVVGTLICTRTYGPLEPLCDFCDGRRAVYTGSVHVKRWIGATKPVACVPFASGFTFWLSSPREAWNGAALALLTHGEGMGTRDLGTKTDFQYRIVGACDTDSWCPSGNGFRWYAVDNPEGRCVLRGRPTCHVPEEPFEETVKSVESILRVMQLEETDRHYRTVVRIANATDAPMTLRDYAFRQVLRTREVPIEERIKDLGRFLTADGVPSPLLHRASQMLAEYTMHYRESTLPLPRDVPAFSLSEFLIQGGPEVLANWAQGSPTREPRIPSWIAERDLPSGTVELAPHVIRQVQAWFPDDNGIRIAKLAGPDECGMKPASVLDVRFSPSGALEAAGVERERVCLANLATVISASEECARRLLCALAEWQTECETEPDSQSKSVRESAIREFAESLRSQLWWHLRCPEDPDDEYRRLTIEEVKVDLVERIRELKVEIDERDLGESDELRRGLENLQSILRDLVKGRE